MLWQVCGQNITWLNSSQSPTQVRKLPLCLQGSCQAGYHLPSEGEFWWSFLDVWSLNLSGVIEPLCFFPSMAVFLPSKTLHTLLHVSDSPWLRWRSVEGWSATPHHLRAVDGIIIIFQISITGDLPARWNSWCGFLNMKSTYRPKDPCFLT